MNGRKEFPEAALKIGEWYRQSLTGSMMARGLRGRLRGRSPRHEILLDHPLPHACPAPDQRPDAPAGAGAHPLRRIPGARLVPLKGDRPRVLPRRNGAHHRRRTGVPRKPGDPASPAGRDAAGTRPAAHGALHRPRRPHRDDAAPGRRKGRDVLREHERITREVLKAHGGAEIKTMGDGFMASFGSVTKAIDCAIALQRAFAAHTESMPEPLRVRVGLNAGKPIAEEGDLFGSTVILAARVAAQARAARSSPRRRATPALGQGLPLRGPRRLRPQRLRRPRAPTSCAGGSSLAPQHFFAAPLCLALLEGVGAVDVVADDSGKSSTRMRRMASVPRSS